MKKFTFAVLAILLFIIPMQHSLAQNNSSIVDPMYSDTYKVTSVLSISDAKAVCKSEAIGKSSATTTKLTATLQKRENGGQWKPVITWSAQASGKNKAIIDQKYVAHSGFDYRLKAVSKIVDSEGVILETVTKYSSIKSY